MFSFITLRSFYGTIILYVGLMMATVAIAELVFDLSGTRAANYWKIENSKSKLKKIRRVFTHY